MTSETRAMSFSMLLGALAMVTVFGLSLSPRAGNQVAVFAWPWAGAGSALRIVAHADGRIVAGGSADWIAVAVAPGSGGVSRLYRSGAMFVADAEFFRACGFFAGRLHG